jgi:hypothetical protein
MEITVSNAFGWSGTGLCANRLSQPGDRVWPQTECRLAVLVVPAPAPADAAAATRTSRASSANRRGFIGLAMA